MGKSKYDGATRENAREAKRMNESYADFLAQRKIDKSPTAAHQFALAMRHKGETFNRSVADVITELEGQLPPYWQ